MCAVAERFVVALADRDQEGLLGLLAPDVEFRALTPGRFWEATSAEEMLDGVLSMWFPPQDDIESVESVEVGDAQGRPRVDYRLRVRNAAGVAYAVEQRAYLDFTNDGLIRRLEIICGGFRRIPIARADSASNNPLPLADDLPPVDASRTEPT